MENTKADSKVDRRARSGFDETSGKVIAAAIEVHRLLGPGFMESVYEEAMKLELAKRSIAFESQKRVDVVYDGKVIGHHVLDLVVDDCLVAELKAVRALDDVHYAQLLSYLRATGCRIGLLLNFNSPTLSVKRVVN